MTGEDRPETHRRVLILGGTGEALALAAALAADPRIEVTTSLAGRTGAPSRPAGRLRIGGFGGADGLLDYLRSERIGLLIDATHPFAGQISRNAVRAASAAGLPLLRLERPAWQRHAEDRWVEVDRLEDAAALAPWHGTRAFLTVGIRELAAFAASGNMWFLVRLIEAPAAPLPLLHYDLILGRGPFAAVEERRLLEQHRIDLVIAKNSGGAATYGKIAAARALGLPVILLRRPTPPAGDAAVATVEEAAQWVATQPPPLGDETTGSAPSTMKAP